MRRRRRQPERPWNENWRNPDLPIYTRVLEERGFGQYEKVHVTIDQNEMQDISQESMRDSGHLKWDKDASYSWGKNAKRRRR